MLKLVTQFDDVRTRATASTPTCGGCCCCCCCCIATVIASSAITNMNLHAAADSNGTSPKKATAASALGLLHVTAAIAALFIITSYFISDLPAGIYSAIGLALLMWILYLTVTFWLAGNKSPVSSAAKTVFITAICLAIEFFIVISIVFGPAVSDLGIGLYVVTSVIVGIAAAVLYKSRLAKKMLPAKGGR